MKSFSKNVVYAHDIYLFTFITIDGHRMALDTGIEEIQLD